MIDPFATWGRLVAAGETMRKTAFNGLDMAGAAQGVIAARTGILAAAAASPLKADHSELGRMVPEKVAAFASASSTTATVMWETGLAWMSYGQQFGAMAMRGRPPTAGEITSLTARWTTLMLTSVEASARVGTAALAPYRRQVKANARRLKGHKVLPV